MRKGLIHLLILFAMLFSGIGAPAIAHGHGHEEHDALVLDHAESHAEVLADVDTGEDRPTDAPGHIVPHHHCSVDLAPVMPAVAQATSASGTILHPIEAARLASRGVAPLTKPPAA